MTYVLGYGVRSTNVYIPKQSHVLETDGLYPIIIIYPSTIIQRNLVPTFDTLSIRYQFFCFVVHARYIHRFAVIRPFPACVIVLECKHQ